MSFRTITLDGSTIEELKERTLAGITVDYAGLLEIALLTIEGSNQDTRQDRINIFIANHNDAPKEHIVSLMKILSLFLWECAKSSPRDGRSLDDILLKVGLPEDFVSPFCKFFRDHRLRLVALKKTLNIHVPQYKDLAWRLDVELARRNLKVMTEPKFMIRLDLNTSTASSSCLPTVFHHVSNTFPDPAPAAAAAPGPGDDYFATQSANTNSNSTAESHTVTSLHFQADYANMKNLQDELQKALDELAGVHANRLTKYIS